MLFYELVYRHTWEDVKPIMLELYPDQEKNSDGYDDVYKELRIITPKLSDIKLSIQKIEDGDFGDYWDVSGVDDDSGDTPAHAIEFTPWQEWLGMDITEQTLNDLSELEILAHALYEMTFVGYDQKHIKSILDGVMQAVEDYKSGRVGAVELDIDEE